MKYKCAFCNNLATSHVDRYHSKTGRRLPPVSVCDDHFPAVEDERKEPEEEPQDYVIPPPDSLEE